MSFKKVVIEPTMCKKKKTNKPITKKPKISFKKSKKNKKPKKSKQLKHLIKSVKDKNWKHL